MNCGQSQNDYEDANEDAYMQGEYEAMAKKVTTEEWKPCFGPTELNVTAGVTGVAARDFLVAYNVGGGVWTRGMGI